MKKLAICAAAIATLLVCGASAQQDTNPWAKFNKGSFAKLKTSTVMLMAGNKNTMTTDTKMTLIDKTADKVVVETETSVMGNVSKTKMDIPLKAAAPAKPPANAPAPKMGSETITVAGKSFACKTFEIVTDTNAGKTTTKTWISEDVPGGVVKTVSSTKGAMNSEMTMELVEYKAL